MIAQWIARALQNRHDTLTLTTAELAEWQCNGCQVDLGAPWHSLGGFAAAHTSKIGKLLQMQLMELPPVDWPTGNHYAGPGGNGRWVWMPALEFVAGQDGKWIVPLIPNDPKHCLDSWAFDLHLSPQELMALQPVAGQLARRMLLRCEIKSVEKATGRDVLWNEGRLDLVNLAGLDLSKLGLWFAQARREGLHRSIQDVDTPEFQSAWFAREGRLAEFAYQAETLNSPRVISQTDDFIQEVQISRVHLMRDLYGMKFTSRRMAVANPLQRMRNLEIFLSHSELTVFKHIVDQALGLEEVPIPVPGDCERTLHQILDVYKDDE